MAEVYWFGSIIGTDEGFDDDGLFAKWKISFGNNWQLIEGSCSGHTQTDYHSIDEKCYWYHPINVHFATCGIQNWPRFEFEVFKEDKFGKVSFVSYGFTYLPSQPGFHQIKCYTWKPVGNIQDRIYSLFTDSSLILKDNEIISNSYERFKIQTETKGIILLELYIITKNFDKFGIELA